MSTAAYLAELVGVGVLAGVVSTVASLASVVSYPALLALGLPRVSANVTSTVAVMFSAVGASAGSRPELAGQRYRVRALGLLTVAGGGAGAALLLLTPPRGFEYVAPALIAAGFLIGGWIGPSIVRHLPARGLRLFIGVCGLAVAIRLGVSAYR